MPNHATCLHDRACRLHDMSPIMHQASLGNSMIYIYIYKYIYTHTYIRYLPKYGGGWAQPPRPPTLYVLGGEVLGHSDSQLQKGPGQTGRQRDRETAR